MLKIAICDDEPHYIQEIREYIPRECQVDTFSDGEELLKADETESYEIVFLDVEMPGKSGIEIAEILKGRQWSPLIIFATNYDEYAPEFFKVQAFRYVRKKQLKRDVTEAIEAALMQVHRNDEIYKFVSKGKVIEIPLSNVIYIEKRQRKCYLAMKNSQGDQGIDGTLRELGMQLRDYKFIRCHTSVLVNLYNVAKEENGNFLMKYGDRVPIAKDRKKVVMQAYKEFLWNL